MTRIIGGFAGSLRLKVPAAFTRPTSDRVREAVFGALESRDALVGARVLDLYAGTGALGLEAASRGAASVTLVDRMNGVVRIGRENADLVRRAAPRGSAPELVVTSSPVQSFLGGALAPGSTSSTSPAPADDREAEPADDPGWDLVFLDPPYELGGPELVHNLEALVPLLARDAIVVVERAARDPEPEWPDGLRLERRRDYGDTAIYWVAPSQPA